MKLIALQDINDTIKAGERFDAPDLIFVAVGLAALDTPIPDPEPDSADADVEEALPTPARRRSRGRQAS